jgi:hypothetical protein
LTEVGANSGAHPARRLQKLQGNAKFSRQSGKAMAAQIDQPSTADLPRQLHFSHLKPLPIIWPVNTLQERELGLQSEVIIADVCMYVEQPRGRLLV